MDKKLREILDKLVAQVMHGEEGQMLDVKYSEDYPNEFDQAILAIHTKYVAKDSIKVDEERLIYILNDRNSLGIRIHELTPEEIASTISQQIGGLIK